MGLMETVLCDWLGWHDEEKSRQQTDAGYVNYVCQRCGNSRYEPR